MIPMLDQKLYNAVKQDNSVTVHGIKLLFHLNCSQNPMWYEFSISLSRACTLSLSLSLSLTLSRCYRQIITFLCTSCYSLVYIDQCLLLQLHKECILWIPLHIHVSHKIILYKHHPVDLYTCMQIHLTLCITYIITESDDLDSILHSCLKPDSPLQASLNRFSHTLHVVDSNPISVTELFLSHRELFTRH